MFDKCFEIIKETGTQNQVVIKGAQPIAEVKSEFGNYLDKVHFMPILNLTNKDPEKFVSDYLNSENPPVAIEFIIKSDTIQILKEFKNIRAKGSSIWVNSLWPQFNAGHDDESAVSDIKVYDWYIKNHVDIIQTDRPQLLLDYLRSKKLHN